MNFPILGILVAFVFSCQKPLERYSHSEVLALPQPPLYITEHVSLKYQLNCGNEKFSDFRVIETNIVFVGTQKLLESSAKKCHITAIGNPDKIKQKFKDVEFKMPSAGDQTFYMSQVFDVTQPKTSVKLFPTFVIKGLSSTATATATSVTTANSQNPANSTTVRPTPQRAP